MTYDYQGAINYLLKSGNQEAKMNPDFDDDTPFNRNARNAAQMIADYRDIHYTEEKMAEEATSSEALILDEVVTVHIFDTRVVIVESEGNVTVLGRFNGDFKAV